jgi:hypothetical protein
VKGDSPSSLGSLPWDGGTDQFSGITVKASAAGEVLAADFSRELLLCPCPAVGRRADRQHGRLLLRHCLLRD